MATITLSVNAGLLAAARRQAADEHTTVEAKFHKWLEGYVQGKKRAERALSTIENLRRKHPPQDRKFTREEMNAR